MGTDRRGIIRFTIDNMIKQCRFKIRTGEKESASQFKKILHMLQRQSIIQILSDDENLTCSPLIENYKLKDLIMCSLMIDLTEQFVVLDTKEKDKIYGYDEEKINHLRLLLYYCYLKCRMYKRPKGDELVKSGGRAEVAYPTFQRINKDLGLTDDTIDKYNKILVALDMIRYKSAGTWYYKTDINKIVRESVNFYTLFTDEENTQHHLNEGIKFFKNMERNSDKVFTGSKNYKNNNKELNGELGSIIKKELHGNATAEDIIRKNQIIFSITANEEQHGIQALLDSNPDTLLSDIYSSFNSEEKADKYYELEKSLGLLDTGKEFGVDFKYYKWIMMNYDKEEHDKFVHCVNNKKKVQLTNDDIIYFADLKPQKQNKKKVVEEDIIIDDESEISDIDFIKEMGWEPKEDTGEEDFFNWSEKDEDLFS